MQLLQHWNSATRGVARCRLLEPGLTRALAARPDRDLFGIVAARCRAPVAAHDHRPTTPDRRLTLCICKALEQFERDLIQERSPTNIAAAVARRRRPVMTDDEIRRARGMADKNRTVHEITAWPRACEMVLHPNEHPRRERWTNILDDH